MGIPYSPLAPSAWHHRRAALFEPGAAGPEQRFDRALQLLAQGRTLDAYRELTVLANAGHAPASRIALLFARRGTALFGGSYPATPGERERWQRSVA